MTHKCKWFKEGQTLKYQLGVWNSVSVKSLRHTPNSVKIRELNLQINDSQSVVCAPPWGSAAHWVGLWGQTIFITLLRHYLPFHSHCLTSVQWSFPDAVWYANCIAEADRRMQLNSIPQTLKRFWNNIKPCHSNTTLRGEWCSFFSPQKYVNM